MSTDVQNTARLSERVAEEVRALLARRRMSGRQLARKLGVSASWVSYRLTGSQPIDLNDAEQIAEALDVPVIDLLPEDKRKGRTTGGYLPGERVIATVGGSDRRVAQPRRPVRRRQPTAQEEMRPPNPIAVRPRPHARCEVNRP